MDASDMKELRVILDNIDALNDEWFDTFPTDEGQTSIHDSLEYEITKANKILAKRPRQCDVGTPEEQSKRLHGYCLNHSSACDVDMECCRCPLEKAKARCEFAWAQMPYEAEEGGAE